MYGKPRHPQNQGGIERYNRTIKDYLTNTYIETEYNGVEFDFIKELSKSLDIYNITKNITIGFSPSYFLV